MAERGLYASSVEYCVYFACLQLQQSVVTLQASAIDYIVEDSIDELCNPVRNTFAVLKSNLNVQKRKCDRSLYNCSLIAAMSQQAKGNPLINMH